MRGAFHRFAWAVCAALWLAVLMAAAPCRADIAVYWFSLGGAYNHGGLWDTGPWPDYHGLRQLIWSPDDPSTHQAYERSDNNLDTNGTEYLLHTYVDSAEDFAMWGPGGYSVYSNSDVGGHDITNGYLFSRIFQDSTPSTGEWYYQSAALSPALMNFDVANPLSVISFNSTLAYGNPVELNRQVVAGPALTLYVSLLSTNPISPYRSWATAATSL